VGRALGPASPHPHRRRLCGPARRSWRVLVLNLRQPLTGTQHSTWDPPTRAVPKSPLFGGLNPVATFSSGDHDPHTSTLTAFHPCTSRIKKGIWYKYKRHRQRRALYSCLSNPHPTNGYPSTPHHNAIDTTRGTHPNSAVNPVISTTVGRFQFCPPPSVRCQTSQVRRVLGLLDPPVHSIPPASILRGGNV